MFIKHILHQRQYRSLSAFYAHSLVRILAVSTYLIFSSLFVYRLLIGHGLNSFQALGITAIFFGILYVFQAVTTIPALWLISKKGLKYSVVAGNIVLIVYLTTLYLSKFDLIFLIISPLIGGLQISLYWIAYHIIFTELTDDKNQGQEVGTATTLSAVASIGGPAFGGLVINYFGFGALFLVSGVSILLANFFLKYIPKQKDEVKVDILEIAKALSPKRELKSLISVMGIGVLDSASLYLWPIFTFPILAGFIGLGFLGSITALVASVASLMIGFLSDKFSPKKLLHVVSSLDSIAWVLSVAITTPIQIFLLSSVRAITTPAQFITIDSLEYERARHINLVAFIVQREIAQAVGRSLFLITTGALLWLGLPLVTIFVIVALVALVTRFYPETKLEV